MDLSTFIVAVFCLLNDRLKGRRARQRGPAPKLSDAEVLTIEVVGEFLGMDTDEAIFRYFRRHYGEWFPALRKVHRTIFARQSAIHVVPHGGRGETGYRRIVHPTPVLDDRNTQIKML